MNATNIEAVDPRFKTFYRVGAIAALTMIAIIVMQLIVFMTVPPPLAGTAQDWFELFQSNKLIGMIDFEFLMIIYVLVSIPFSLALYFALRRTDEAFMTLFLTVVVIGVISFIFARPVLEMLYLSERFAVAATEAQKAALLAAGESKLAAFHGTAFQISYVLGSLNGVIVSLVMLKSNIFSKATAYVRLGSSVFDFGLYVPVIGTYLSIFSVLFLFAWNIMVARRLLQLARLSSQVQST